MPELAGRVAIEWAAREGWNPGLDDLDRFLAADPDAFLGVASEDGKVAGTVSCALYGDGYAFIGFYIVRPELRGRGIGTSLFDRALARAGERVVGLDGVLEQQPVYASLGFELAHRNERWSATGRGTVPDGLTDLGDVPFELLSEYDRDVFGADRRTFLRAWVNQPSGRGVAAFDAGEIDGYVVLRECHEGMKIGPLFADDVEIAERLLVAALATAGMGMPIFLDVPHANEAALALAREHLEAPAFETARMYLGGRPPEDLERVYGVTSFEFG